VVYLEHEALPGVFTVDHVHMVRVLASQFAVSIQNVRLLEEARVHRAASLRFVPQQARDCVWYVLYRSHARTRPTQALGLLGMRTVDQVRLGASATFTCTVLFLDVRGFTRLAERAPPQRTFRLLNMLLAGEYACMCA
jgi:GAF domain-containing protein